MSPRNIARAVGILFIAGDVAGIAGALLTNSVDVNHLDDVALHPDRYQLAALLILTMGLCLAAIPAVVFPLLRRYSQPAAVGYVVFRGAAEFACYIASTALWLALVPMAKDYSDGIDPATARRSARYVLEAGDNTGAVTAIVFAVGALIFCRVVWTARLVPRWLAGWGLVSAPLYLASGVGGVFGTGIGVLMAPLAVQEVVLSVWLIVRGFDQPRTVDPRDATPTPPHLATLG